MRRTFGRGSWRLAVLVALTAVALLGAACSGVLAGGEEREGGGQPGTSEPAPPGHTPPPLDGDDVIGDPDTPVSDRNPMPVPPADGEDPVDDTEARRLERAPIDELDLLVLESYPPQYVVEIVSGLPSGCAAFSHTEVERSGTTITVTVWNTMPADDGAICTMIYGMHRSSVNLGSDFESGTEYTVKVNGEAITFVAQ